MKVLSLLLLLGALVVGPHTISSAQAWDFEHSFTTPIDANALDYVVLQENITVSNEGSIQYWRPVSTGVQATLRKHFVFPAGITESDIYVYLTVWNLGSWQGYGSIHVSDNAADWTLLLDAPNPSTTAVAYTYSGPLPGELLGSTELYVEVRMMRISGISVTPQFCRSGSGGNYPNPVFAVRVNYSQDCDGNGIPDPEDIENGAPDCDSNGELDVCQPDSDGDGTIDPCDDDIDGDGILNECDMDLVAGADCDENGTLDLSEDVDQDGTLGILHVVNSEFGEGVFIKEDLNGNGEIDPTEDSNSNDRLDGGSLENNVLALIRDNRLVLVSLAGGSNTIDLREDDSVLLDLGFFEEVDGGLPILKEIQLNDLNTPENLIVQPQTAIVEVDGNFFSSNTDVVTGVIEDTALVLRQASETSAKITIFIDAPTFFEQIKILFSQFNNSIAKINDLLAVSNSFGEDGDIQDIRNDLTIDPQKEARVLQERNRIIDDLRGRPGNSQATGVSVKNTEKRAQQEVAVTSIVKGIQSGLNFPSQNGDENLLKRLSSIGIRTLTDNTFALDETEFERGLEKNTLEVFDLFTNSETGILPLLAERLENIVLEGRGDLAIKQTKVIIESGAPNILAENFRKFTENSNLGATVQTLIAVA